MQKMSIHTVSNCLSVEASGTIKGITISAATKFCKAKSKTLKTGATFSQAFSDRTIEVMGGDGDMGDILFNPNSAAGYKKWLRSLKTVPGVVSFQLSPLHLLVRTNNTNSGVVQGIHRHTGSTGYPVRTPSFFTEHWIYHLLNVALKSALDGVPTTPAGKFSRLFQVFSRLFFQFSRFLNFPSLAR